MTRRGKWHGMLAIAAFNWPFYAVAAAVIVAAGIGLDVWNSTTLRVLCLLALLGSTYLLLGSLVVSHLVYDRSDLYRWQWLKRAIPKSGVREIIFCHSGFDEASRDLQKHLPEANCRILDHFDEQRMTEASIRRARRRFPPVPGTVAAPHSAWPIEDGTADVIFGVLAIHELRSEEERTNWFDEAARCTRKAGRIVLVEHLRDLANFLAFGPGFLHFHSRASWRRCWEHAGFRLADEFRITPWVHVFVLTCT